MLDIQYILINFLDKDIINYIYSKIKSSNIEIENDTDLQLECMRKIKSNLIENISNDTILLSDTKYEKLFGSFGHVEIIKNITIKISNNGLLNFVYNSKIQAFYMWTDITLQTRGIILDLFDNFNIVSLPYYKFFNINEYNIKNADYQTLLESHKNIPFIALDKLDGALGQLFYHNEEYKIITKGGFNNLEGQFATDWLYNNINITENLYNIVEQYTLLFEIITPEGFFKNDVEDNSNFSHIINYGEIEGIILIGVRDKITGELLHYDKIISIGEELGINVVSEITDFNNIEEIYKYMHNSMDESEGVVLYFDNGDIFKLKTKYYLIKQYRRYGLSDKKILKALKQGSIDEFIEKTPEELHGELFEKLDKIKNKFHNTYIGPSIKYYLKKIYGFNLDKHLLYLQLNKDINNKVMREIILKLSRMNINNIDKDFNVSQDFIDQSFYTYICKL